MEKKYADSFVNELVAFYRKQLANVRELKLSKNNDDIPHQHILSHATYSPWSEHAAFQETWQRIKDNTLVDIYRCYELWNLIERHPQVEGDILEVGVWRGGTGCLMAKAAQVFAPQTKVYLADTFTGVVKASDKDTEYKGGEHADTSIGIVRQLVTDLGLRNVELLVGIFPDQVDLPATSTRPLKLCHIDVDTHTSAQHIFERVWPMMAHGGAVVFDDYGFWGCEGITRLCNELRPVDATFIHNVNGHAIFIKR